MDPSRPFEARGRSLLPAGTGGSKLERTRTESFDALPPRLGRGDVLGGFALEREIASGATAAIYEAQDPRRRRRVALKVLSPHLAAVPAAAARFRAEAALAERIEHRCLIPIHGCGKDRGHYFYAMRLESGDTAERLAVEAADRDDEPFFHRLARLFAGVARALDLVHRAGIVHRDVKPDNLLLAADGSLVLCDFGSALDSGDRSTHLERSLWGTVRYMSPEQLRPGADPYDPSADIYALGLTLYEAATGVSPFPRCSEEDLIRLKLTRPVPPPQRVHPAVPLGLDAIIRQAIEPCRGLRHSGIAGLAEDLERFSEGKRGHRR